MFSIEKFLAGAAVSTTPPAWGQITSRFVGQHGVFFSHPAHQNMYAIGVRSGDGCSVGCTEAGCAHERTPDTLTIVTIVTRLSQRWSFSRGERSVSLADQWAPCVASGLSGVSLGSDRKCGLRARTDFSPASRSDALNINLSRETQWTQQH